MGKANISFPPGMLEDIDHRAARSGATRSGFVQEAVTAYLTQLDHAVEQERRTARIEAALLGMRAIGASLAPGSDGATLIRTDRDRLPGWLEDKPHGDDE